VIGLKVSVLAYAGRWEERLPVRERAAELDPLSADNWGSLAEEYCARGDLVQAERFIDRAIAVDSGAIGLKFWFLLHALGDTIGARELTDRHRELRESPGTSKSLAYVRRDYARALELLSPPSAISDPDWVGNPHLWRQVMILFQLMDEPQRLRSMAEAFTLEFETALQEAIAAAATASTGFSYLHLAQANAFLGDTAAAMRQAGRALEVHRASPGAFNDFYFLQDLAMVYVAAGDHDRAINTLEELLSIRGGGWRCHYGTARLRLDPFYDPLRTDPRFVALLEKYDRRRHSYDPSQEAARRDPPAFGLAGAGGLPRRFLRRAGGGGVLQRRVLE
jgi:tetratricopeptide (TPR) repeat protein